MCVWLLVAGGPAAAKEFPVSFKPSRDGRFRFDEKAQVFYGGTARDRMRIGRYAKGHQSWGWATGLSVSIHHPTQPLSLAKCREYAFSRKATLGTMVMIEGSRRYAFVCTSPCRGKRGERIAPVELHEWLDGKRLERSPRDVVIGLHPWSDRRMASRHAATGDGDVIPRVVFQKTSTYWMAWGGDLSTSYFRNAGRIMALGLEGKGEEQRAEILKALDTVAAVPRPYDRFIADRRGARGSKRRPERASKDKTKAEKKPAPSEGKKPGAAAGSQDEPEPAEPKPKVPASRE
jgi:hypothetical protein